MQIPQATHNHEYSTRHTNEENIPIADNYFQSSSNNSQTSINNQKSLSSVRPTHLDAIVEESSEDNVDESNETSSPIK